MEYHCVVAMPTRSFIAVTVDSRASKWFDPPMTTRREIWRVPCRMPRRTRYAKTMATVTPMVRNRTGSRPCRWKFCLKFFRSYYRYDDYRPRDPAPFGDRRSECDADRRLPSESSEITMATMEARLLVQSR